MLEELRKKARKATLIRAGILVIVAIICLAVTKLGIFSYLAGPKDITNLENWDADELDGKYVTVDVDYAWGSFAEETSTNTKTHITTTTSMCYLCAHFGANEETDPVLYGVKVSNSNKSGMEQIVDQMYDDSVAEITAHQKVTGTFKKMSDKMLQYYEETIEEGLGAQYLDYSVPYCIYDETVGGMEIVLVFMLSIVAAICIIIAVITVILFLSGSYDKHLKKFLKANERESMAGLTADFDSATVINSDIHIGKKYIFYQKGVCCRILPINNLVWAYYYHRSGRNSISAIRAFDMQKKVTMISVSKNTSDAVLAYLNDNAKHVVLGYDKELEKTFKNNFSEFLNLRYNEAKAAETEDGFSAQYNM